MPNRPQFLDRMSRNEKKESNHKNPNRKITREYFGLRRAWDKRSSLSPACSLTFTHFLCVNVERPQWSLLKQRKSSPKRVLSCECAHALMSNARYAAYLNKRNQHKEPMKTERRVSLIPLTHLTRTRKILFRGTQSNPRPSKAKKYIVVIEVR